MTITQLIYTIAVAEYKNFTLAAEKSFVTQPTLSMQIQKLEEELGVIIFDRTTKPIQLTEVGAIIVKQAQKIVEESNRIKDIVDQQKGYIGGEFRLGIIPTITPTLLPMFLKTFIKKHPKVNLIIEEYNTDEIIQRLRNGQIDAAIAATPLDEADIKEAVLYYEPFVGYFPDKFRQGLSKEINVSDVDINNLLLLHDGHCFRNSIINLCKPSASENDLPFKLESGSFETLIKIANEGLGITLLPYLHTLDLKSEYLVNLVQFKDPKPAREVSLIYRKSELKIQIIEALKESIQSVIRGAIAFSDIQIISPKLKRHS
ncbi:hydrogen peroxide-inducible genes activator [Flavobacterium sp. HSC-61S13]|uniref:hydrogen peroxide-inducible genes activator n=1 Tax=Flavobacterium sp. HSC-61S13 TaxID=2910963 RepID=UPI00209C78A1|nr:hydrogen peroxide-inducible genes activator [Flavobacterium sp. HSC-61S13]MCP1997118.1 LysR family hydrogen peroxide-inducible transcriptional activator [Flavobacterium sp. HSC-61S13]